MEPGQAHCSAKPIGLIQIRPSSNLCDRISVEKASAICLIGSRRPIHDLTADWTAFTRSLHAEISRQRSLSSSQRVKPKHRPQGLQRSSRTRKENSDAG
jgi:hypothetical protein